jgi:DNA-binding NtrC family response regulator|nr:response regulator [Candidatus Krumholzibacteria bacterium]
MTDDSSPVRLLIVDDEEDLVTFLSHRLRKRGLDVTMALSGAEAVSAGNELGFDVAVVDLKMPDMDGIAVIEHLKDAQPFMEVIMLTGHGSHDSAWEAGRLQAFRYLMKPYDFDELYDVILAAADQRRRKMQAEFEGKLQELMTSTTSPRDLIELSEQLRREYEQD